MKAYTHPMAELLMLENEDVLTSSDNFKSDFFAKPPETTTAEEA